MLRYKFVYECALPPPPPPYNMNAVLNGITNPITKSPKNPQGENFIVFAHPIELGGAVILQIPEVKASINILCTFYISRNQALAGGGWGGGWGGGGIIAH